ncbi:Ribosomal RNA large subunit methyltransferase E [Carpediemonas membranifera]|uniref:Putative tRNA (cytidine(32)/guanosine(34)-2'-O)-methyltransferase n=1 Tax=Carpediemonas membranifera TaxID=201153 RepID=A0A8J6E4D6_9EUKA|nr:Ribosomal RNA large subunit methyltransferase E [Carpediemonas membranifera]|eukprot:KAG9396806.1 Ribosomal RNA large subunit methyltransferase E [Carpediemonas membranifera]
MAERDVYYRRAKEEGWRARSAFKLLEIDANFSVLQGVQRAVDLCAAPGSWSQVLSRVIYERSEKKDDIRLIAVDLNEMAPLPGVIQLQGDICSTTTAQQIITHFEGQKSDIVVCDGAPDVTGLHDLDTMMQSQLLTAAILITTFVLREGGNFVAKIFKGGDTSLIVAQLELFFSYVRIHKPPSSRAASQEAFVVCKGFKLPADYVPTMDVDADPETLTPTTRKLLPFLVNGDLSGFDPVDTETIAI